MKHRIVSLVAALVLTMGVSALAERQYYGSELCGYSNFKCVQVKGGDTWEKLFPDARNREIVKRLNRTNISLQYRSWIVIPANLTNIDFMDLSPFPSHLNTNGKKLVVVDIGKQAFGAFDATGNQVHWGPISAGKGYCRDGENQECHTRTGGFILFDKKGASCKSAVFPVETGGGAPMPFCMYFYRGFALHGSTLPGFNASHGCVRLFNDDAIWLNKKFTEANTKVIIKE